MNNCKQDFIRFVIPPRYFVNMFQKINLQPSISNLFLSTPVVSYCCPLVGQRGIYQIMKISPKLYIFLRVGTWIEHSSNLQFIAELFGRKKMENKNNDLGPHPATYSSSQTNWETLLKIIEYGLIR